MVLYCFTPPIVDESDDKIFQYIGVFKHFFQPNLAYGKSLMDEDNYFLLYYNESHTPLMGDNEILKGNLTMFKNFL